MKDIDLALLFLSFCVGAQSSGENLRVEEVEFANRGAARQSAASPALSTLDRQDATGQTELMLAVRDDRHDAARELLKGGASINFKDPYGWTALTYAVASENADVVDTLLASGADVDARDRRGMTPLMWAALSGNKKVLEKLLAAGANVNATAANGATSFAIADATGWRAGVTMLSKAGGKGKMDAALVPKYVIPVDAAPQVLRHERPRIKPEAYAGRAVRPIRIRVLIDVDGAVKDIVIVSRPVDELTREVARAFAQGHLPKYWSASEGKEVPKRPRPVRDARE
jgi:hypothetical protein